MVTSTPPEPKRKQGGGGGQRRNSSAQRSADRSRQERPHTPKTKFTKYQIRCHTEQGPVTRRQTLVTTPVCLSTKGNSPTGSQVRCHCHQMWEKFQDHIKRVQ